MLAVCADDELAVVIAPVFFFILFFKPGATEGNPGRRSDVSGPRGGACGSIGTPCIMWRAAARNLCGIGRKAQQLFLDARTGGKVQCWTFSDSSAPPNSPPPSPSLKLKHRTGKGRTQTLTISGAVAVRECTALATRHYASFDVILWSDAAPLLLPDGAAVPI